MNAYVNGYQINKDVAELEALAAAGQDVYSDMATRLLDLLKRINHRVNRRSDTLVHNPVVSRHRNGIGGEPFAVVTFDTPEAAGRMVGIVFDEPGAVAVLNVPRLLYDDTAFAQGNSWRGDVFEWELRRAVDDYDAKQDAKWRTTAEREEAAQQAREIALMEYIAANGENV